MKDNSPELIDHQELHNRSILIGKIRSFWIENVLQRTIEPGRRSDFIWRGRPDLLPASPGPNQTGRAATLFDQAGRRLLILGETGDGKTTFLLKLASDLLDRAEEDADQPVPVVLHLSSWKKSAGSFEKWLIEELRLKYQTPKRISASWLKAGSLALLLDGLDELNPQQQQGCINALNGFLTHYQGGVVVCCESKVYDRLTERLELIAAIEILPPGDDQPIAFFQRKPGKQALAEYIQAKLAAQKDNLHHDPESLTGRLSWLARSMIQHGQTIFLIEDLQADWLPPGEAVGRYRKTVVWVILFPATACLLAATLALLSSRFLIGEGFIQGAILIAWLAAVAYGVYTSLELVKIEPPDDLHWSWSQVGRLVIFCLCQSILAFVFPLLALLNGFSRGEIDSNHEPNQGMKRAEWLAFTAALLSALLFVLPPTGLLGLTFVSMPAAGSAWLAMLVLLPFVFLPSYGVVLALGGKTLLQHSILRRLLIAYQRLPNDLSDFFEDAINCGFLLPVGSGYLFRHRLLMEYFASLDKTAGEEAQDCITNAAECADLGDYEQAIALYTQALEIPIWERTGKFDRQDIRAARAGCVLELAQAFLEEDEPIEAVSVLQTALGWDDAPAKIRELHRAAKDKQAAFYLQNARECRKTWQALYFYNRALEHTGWTGIELAWLGKAGCLLAMHKYQASIDACEQALAEGAAPGPFLAIRGEAHYYLNQFERAAQHLNTVIRAEGGDDWVLALCGDALRRVGKFAEAIAILHQAVELLPEDELYLEWRGLAHLAGSDIQAAMDDFTRLWEIQKGYRRAYASFLCSLASRANQEQAQDYLTDAIYQAEKLHQQCYYWENAFNLALYYLAADAPQAALELYQEILTNRPPENQVYQAMRKLDDFEQLSPDQEQISAFRELFSESIQRFHLQQDSRLPAG